MGGLAFMREEKRDDGILVSVAGGSRSGKTAWTMQQIKQAPRALIWDPRGEYTAAGCELVQDVRELAGMLKEAWDGEGKFSFFGPLKDFQQWARLAYLWGQLWPAAIVAEELADVTSSGGGRGEWGELIRKGLYYGSHIYAVTQRPQEVDKTTWGNATVRHCHRLELPLDADYMGRVLGCDPAMVAALDRLEWIEKRAGDAPGAIHRGKVTF